MTDPRLRRLTRKLARYGCELRPLFDGYAVYVDGDMLTYCANLDAIDALLMTEAEFQRAVRSVTRKLKSVL